MERKNIKEGVAGAGYAAAFPGLVALAFRLRQTRWVGNCKLRRSTQRPAISSKMTLKIGVSSSRAKQSKPIIREASAMSMFSSILEKLGLTHKAADPPLPADANVPKIAESQPPIQASVAPVRVPAMSAVDVVAKLDALAASNAQTLDWKKSIVDLLKLLDLDSSLGARKTLAVELGCPDEKLGDSASMNLWLHKTVLQKLAENGGNVPHELL